MAKHRLIVVDNISIKTYFSYLFKKHKIKLTFFAYLIN